MPVGGSGAVVSAWSLLIRRPQRACRQAETPLIVLCRFPGPALWSHLKTTSTSVRSSLDEQSKWSEAQRVGLNQQEVLLTACQEGPSRAASYRFITIVAAPPTSQRTRNRVYASCGTETPRACARCVIGLDGRCLRPISQRRRLNAADVVRMQHS